MSVLSRRLERFAAGFSVVTFALFLLGLYSAANHEGQMLYLSAGLGSVCLLAAFFLWLAHGFAWAMIPTEALAVRKPAEALEEMRSAEAQRPAEVLQPVEVSKPAEERPAVETKRPTGVLWHGEEVKPLEPLPPLEEELKPLEVTKPVEEMEPAEDPPDAKYNITGRRIN